MSMFKTRWPGNRFQLKVNNVTDSLYANDICDEVNMHLEENFQTFSIAHSIPIQYMRYY